MVFELFWSEIGYRFNHFELKVGKRQDFIEKGMNVHVHVETPGGVLGYVNVTEGGEGVRWSLIFYSQKNTWTLYCAPKKIQDSGYLCRLFKSCFRILRELWLELRKNY